MLAGRPGRVDDGDLRPRRVRPGLVHRPNVPSLGPVVQGRAECGQEPRQRRLRRSSHGCRTVRDPGRAGPRRPVGRGRRGRRWPSRVRRRRPPCRRRVRARGDGHRRSWPGAPALAQPGAGRSVELAWPGPAAAAVGGGEGQRHPRPHPLGALGPGRRHADGGDLGARAASATGVAGNVALHHGLRAVAARVDRHDGGAERRARRLPAGRRDAPLPVGGGARRRRRPHPARSPVRAGRRPRAADADGGRRRDGARLSGWAAGRCGPARPAVHRAGPRRVRRRHGAVAGRIP